MAHTERFGRRHPLCTCPEVSGLFGSTRIDARPGCPGGTIAHPVISLDEIWAVAESGALDPNYQHRMVANHFDIWDRPEAKHPGPGCPCGGPWCGT